VCHAVLQDPDFFLFLLRIDEEFAAETRGTQCQHCGGVLHSARYPRKPHGCPASVLEDYSWRFSFTCARCEQRATPASVRFFGRRVYLAVVLTQLTLQDAEVIVAALEHFQKRPALGFSDCLVLEIARKAGHLPLGTFDRNLSNCLTR
jgi:hypothetical protein